MKNKLLNLVMKKVLVKKKDHIKILNKLDFTMFPAKAYAKFLQRLGEDFGDKWLFDFGYKYGDMVGKHFVKELKWDKPPTKKRLKLMNIMMEVLGFGNIDMQEWYPKKGIMWLRTSNNPTINWSYKLFGKEEKACIIYRAIYSAHAHNEFGIRNCHMIETKCISKGDSYCEWSFNWFDKDVEKVGGIETI